MTSIGSWLVGKLANAKSEALVSWHVRRLYRSHNLNSVTKRSPSNCSA